MMIVIFLCELMATRQAVIVQVGRLVVVLRQQRPARRLQQRLAFGVVAERTGQLQRADQLAGDGRAAVGRCVLRQCAAHRGDQATHPLCRRLADLGGLARHLRGERSHRATGFDVAEVAIGQVAFHQGAQGAGAARLAHGGALSDTGRTVLARTLEGFGQQGIARAEVGVEAAVGQPGLFHDVGDAHAVESASADRPRGGRDDALMAEFFAAGWAVHGVNFSRKYDECHIY